MPILRHLCTHTTTRFLVLALFIFVVSLASLIFASDRFIGAAEKIGYSLGVSPFIIGVTIVAFGTSLPELTTSVIAVLSNTSEIVVGNVVGSNITNILLVLGISAIAARPLRIERDLMKNEMPLLFGSALLLWFSLRDFDLSMIEALIFLAGLIGFLTYSIKGQVAEEQDRMRTGVLTYAILIAAGFAVYLSANYTVSSIETLATGLGISPSIVSLSLLALGTSLPEVVVSVAAVRKGNHSMALGNVIGSNLFNTYAVMAIPSFFGEMIIPQGIMTFSLPFMVAVTALLWITVIGREISFWKAGMLVSFYIFYLVELIRLSFVS
ncbi:MAG: calcium/sodium antiporter [Bacteroidota bacterium]